MCLWDNRAGRQKDYDPHLQTDIPISVPARVLGANPTRTRVILTFIGVDIPPVAQLLVHAGRQGGPVVGALSSYHPVWEADVTTHGQIVLGEIWVSDQNESGLSVGATEVYLHAELDQL